MRVVLEATANVLRPAPTRLGFGSADCYIVNPLCGFTGEETAVRTVQKSTPIFSEHDLTVDNDAFDAVLRKMIEAEPTERKDIKPEAEKPDRVIPSPAQGR